MYSRRELVFSLVERTDADDAEDFSAAVIDGSTQPVINSAFHQTSAQRRRNASLKVGYSTALIFIDEINSRTMCLNCPAQLFYLFLKIMFLKKKPVLPVAAGKKTRNGDGAKFFFIIYFYAR